MLTDWFRAITEPRAITGVAALIGLGLMVLVIRWDERRFHSRQTERQFRGNRDEQP